MYLISGFTAYGCTDPDATNYVASANNDSSYDMQVLGVL